MPRASRLAIAASVIVCCHAAFAQTTSAPPANSTPQPPAPAASPPPPPTPIVFNDAVLKAANDLLSKANTTPGADGKVVLLIDPLIDGVTGAQSAATQSMGRRIVELVHSSYPKYEVKPFTLAEVQHNPLVLIGTFTPVNNAGTPGGAKDAYRICLALADLGSKKIVSKGVARAKLDSVDATPTPNFADAPVFTKDAAVDAYVKSCQGTKPGDPIEQAYVDRIVSAALVAGAIQAYDDRKYQQALDLYEKASKVEGGDQLRVLNGFYLTNWRLHRQQAALQSFNRLVDYGLHNDRLAVKFLFKKGTTQLVSTSGAATPYDMWLKSIATKLASSKSCLDVVGHASPTGPAEFNDTLSAMRAKYVAQRIASLARKADGQMVPSGVGSRQTLIGTGRDDASDALDRRVEFKVDSECAKKGNSAGLGQRRVNEMSASLH